jgi:hypothetical protein
MGVTRRQQNGKREFVHHQRHAAHITLVHPRATLQLYSLVAHCIAHNHALNLDALANNLVGGCGWCRPLWSDVPCRISAGIGCRPQAGAPKR